MGKGAIDTGQVFRINSAQCSLFFGMSKGQESRFSAIFDLLCSFSGPQKSQHKSRHKFLSLGDHLFFASKDTLRFPIESIFGTIHFFNHNRYKNDNILLENGKS